MTVETLKEIIAVGEDSKNQFKADFTNATSLAAEMVAFSNCQGGTIFIGVADDGEIIGLTRERIGHLNQLVSNAASQLVHPPVNPLSENIMTDKGVVLCVKIPEGILKPYMDNSGVMWVKSGADKRRVTSREEIQRILQGANLIHGDEIGVPNAGFDKVDKDYFKKFYQKVFNEPFSLSKDEIPRILENMNLARNGLLNVAGALLVAEEPNFFMPVFMVKAVCYPGNDIHADTYVDSEDIAGRIETQFKQAIAFVSRNIRHIQAGQNVNSVGVLEIPKVVLEEIIANALIHRDYFYPASVRIFIFSNRIEVISPGSLPDNLTVDMMRYGVSCPRNNVLASFANKVLVYRGLGNGIIRALKEYPNIAFENDIDGNQFKVIIERTFEFENSIKPEDGQKNRTQNGNERHNEQINRTENKTEQKTEQKIRTEKDNQLIRIKGLIAENPSITRKQLSEILSISSAAVQRRLATMVKIGLIKRVGPDKGGHWEVL